MLKNLIRKLLYLFQLPLYSCQKNFYNGKNDPVIIISANRSGSTILHDILSQNPQLRSLGKNTKNKVIKNDHVSGWDYPLWRIFDPIFGDHFNKKKEGFIWCHPKYISSFYKEDFFLKNYLYYEIYKKHSTKIPLIKNHFFPLRIKLLKKIFPNAKIIFNIRNYQDFIKSNLHKNKTDNQYKFAFEGNNLPDVGLHWLMINTVAIYHLEKYYKNQYLIFKNEILYQDHFLLNKELNKINKFLNLEELQYNLEEVSKKDNFVKKINHNYTDLDEIIKLANYEKRNE